MDGSWPLLLDVAPFLGGAGAVILGIACERIGQNPILSYLLAGVFFGPDALDLLESHEALEDLTELGVTLQLFSLGLELASGELRSFGRAPVVGGAVQVGLATLIVALAPGLSLSATGHEPGRAHGTKDLFPPGRR